MNTIICLHVTDDDGPCICCKAWMSMLEDEEE